MPHADPGQDRRRQALAIDVRDVPLVEIEAIGDLVRFPARAFEGDQLVVDLVIGRDVEILDQREGAAAHLAVGTARAALLDVERRPGERLGAILAPAGRRQEEQGRGQPEYVLHPSYSARSCTALPASR